MGGLSFGAGVGALASVVGLAALSLSSPLPTRDRVAEDGAGDAVLATTPDGAAQATEPTADAAPDQASGDQASGALTPTTPDVPPAEGESAGNGSLAETATDTSTPAATPTEAAAAATDVPLPSGSEFNRPPPEPAAALSQPDGAPRVIAPQNLAEAGDVSAPILDTAPPAVPAVTAGAPTQVAALSPPDAGPASPAPGTAPRISGEPSGLAQQNQSALPRVNTSQLPQVIARPEITSEVGPEVGPEVGADAGSDAVGEAGTEQAASVDADAGAAPQAPSLPSIGDGITSAPQLPSLPESAASAFADRAVDGPVDSPVGGAEPVLPSDESAEAVSDQPQTRTLPQVTARVPSQVIPDVASVAPDQPASEGARDGDVAPDAPVDPADLPAIQAFAAPYEQTDDRAVMSVILIDEPDSRIEIETLTRFTFPVAFAIDPLRPDAAERAAVYRDAGFEVVIMGTMIPTGATAADVEVALESARMILPEAVAFLDTIEGRIQRDRVVLDATVASVSETGHGLVAFPGGLNAVEQTASRAAIPAATVFRLLDDDDQRATVIARFLSRAAFTAAQEGRVVVVGRTRPDTVTALFSWALSGRSEAVAMAPLSHVLQAVSPE